MDPFIHPAGLKTSLDDPTLNIVDCRFNLLQPDAGRFAFERGRIPGAVYAHLDDDLAGKLDAASGRHPLPDVDAFCEWLGRQGISEQTRVVVYDDAGGAIAARLWWLLKRLGHEQCSILSGGFDAWRKAGYPIVSGSNDPVLPVPYTMSNGDWDVVSTREVEERLTDGTVSRLLDARARRRFNGDEEPIDPVAGHIPGSTNLPFDALQDDEQGILDPASLVAVFTEALGGDVRSPWAAMCGSGVTACYLAAAAEYAGIRRPALYVGSFSEWIRDENRPVAPGKMMRT